MPFLPLLVLGACTTEPTVPAPAEPTAPADPLASRPNVVVVTLDTTRADHLSPYGGPLDATPTMARLAREGSTFTRAYTVTPLTIPAHASLHTGLLPPRHGVRDNGADFLDAGAVTLAETLQSAGYATMASVGAEVTSHHWGFNQGFDTYFDDMGGPRRGTNRWAIERPGAAVVDDALGWLSARPAGAGPFFAWVHLFDAHDPYQPVEPYRSQFKARPYLAEIASTDAQVARLLAFLEERDVLSNTWVVVLADHGEGLGEHGEAMHGSLLYDTTTRIPLLIRPPGGRALVDRIPFPVSIVDVAPTVLAVTGLAAQSEMDGIDLSPWVAPRGIPAPRYRTDRAVYMESLYPWRHYGWAPQRAVADMLFKFIDGTPGELFARTEPTQEDDLIVVQEVVANGLRAYIDEHYTGLEPVVGAQGRAGLDATRQAQLEALGYLTSGAPPAQSGAQSGGLSEDPPFRGDLPLPRDQRDAMRRLEAGRQAMRAGDLPTAETEARALLAAAPGMEMAAMQLAHILARQGKVDEALATASRLDAERPSAISRTLVAHLLLQRGDRAAGAATLRDAVELDPYLVDTWMSYLMVLWENGDRELFITEVQRAATKVPEEPAVLAWQGMAQALGGDRAGGRARLESALTQDPLVPLAHEALARIALAEGDPIAAEPLLVAEMRLHPPALSARRQLVILLAGQSRYEDQIRALDELVALERPASAETALSHAQAWFNLDNLDKSEAALGRCVDLNPRSAGCALLQANVLDRKGDKAGAQAAFERAKALHGG
jgi:choline-sulfatase